MAITFNPLANTLPLQDVQSTQALKRTQSAEQVQDVSERQATAAPKQALKLHGLHEVEQLAHQQATSAALEVGEQKLQSALQKLEQEQQLPVEDLEELSQLINTANFQGQALLTEEAPVLEELTQLSDNPPYFMTSASEAVSTFRELMAEQLEAEMSSQTSGIALGEPLAAELQDQLAQVLDHPELEAGDELSARLEAQGLEFQLEAEAAANDQGELYLNDQSTLTTVVNGNELVLHGPFIRLVGPVSDDQLQLPSNEQQQPQVAIHLQEKLDQLSATDSLLSMNPEELVQRLQEAAQIFDELRERINTGGQQTPVQAQDNLQASLAVFAQEPWAAMNTQAHATPDLVLNTIAE